jgi:ribosomal protein S18 acetylase RimI-like enzyme
MGSMKLDTKPASDYSMPDLVQLLNLSFENYLVPVRFEPAQFLTMLRKDTVDLSASRVLLADGDTAGIALVARRGWTSRLAAMGIVKEMRAKAAGTWFMEGLVREARERGDREIVLEVFEQNEAAVRLYRKCGFQTVRRLIGLVCREYVEPDAKNGLLEMDLRGIGSLVSLHGLPDLPWQLSGETIALLTPPARAFARDKAYVAVSNPDAEHVAIWSLLVESRARGKGLAAELLRQVMSSYVDKTWHVPAILPEELGGVFERVGFRREELSQWQMSLML